MTTTTMTTGTTQAIECLQDSGESQPQDGEASNCYTKQHACTYVTASASAGKACGSCARTRFRHWMMLRSCACAQLWRSCFQDACKMHVCLCAALALMLSRCLQEHVWPAAVCSRWSSLGYAGAASSTACRTRRWMHDVALLVVHLMQLCTRACRFGAQSTCGLLPPAPGEVLLDVPVPPAALPAGPGAGSMMLRWWST
jgi:hypothetical protein